MYGARFVSSLSNASLEDLMALTVTRQVKACEQRCKARSHATRMRLFQVEHSLHKSWMSLADERKKRGMFCSEAYHEHAERAYDTIRRATFAG